MPHFLAVSEPHTALCKLTGVFQVHREDESERHEGNQRDLLRYLEPGERHRLRLALG